MPIFVTIILTWILFGIIAIILFSSIPPITSSLVKLKLLSITANKSQINLSLIVIILSLIPIPIILTWNWLIYSSIFWYLSLMAMCIDAMFAKESDMDFLLNDGKIEKMENNE